MKDFNDAEKNVLTHAGIELEKTPDRSRETIRKLVETFATVANITQPSLVVDVEAVSAQLEHAASVWIEPAKVLSDNRVKPWWPSRRPELAPMRFWLRYRRYLLQEKGRSSADLDAVDEQTDLIIDRIQNPVEPGQWDVRGMVVGSVQSGKTANYVGVIAKALDAGYRLIIVMAGIHNNLRAQTQARIDEGIVGYDSQRRRTPDNPECKLGVGKLIIPEIETPPSITPLTSSADDGDFTTGVQRANASLAGGPVILVVKKNVTPLKHILEWTQVQAGQLGIHGAGGKISNVPLLLIDDEADNASINTKDKPGTGADEFNITRINKQIRLILNRFHQSAYIGYTATPFANIFINPEAERDDEGGDLFPRDFIVNVRPSNRYIGPARVFGYAGDLEAGIEGLPGLPMVIEVDDHEDCFPPKHKVDHIPNALPASLVEAIQSFLLTCAARRARGQKRVHNSMLIHVTRFVAVQKEVKELVEQEFRRMKRAITYDSKACPVWESLKALWAGDFSERSRQVRNIEQDPQLNDIQWTEIEAELPAVVARLQVKVIHGKSKEKLGYDSEPDGLTVIAVGGNKLSRGLTLEDLSVSYFLRSTRMYDTLMQMGRWFGYRDGYLDLCRLYTTSVLQSWFSYVAQAEVELKREFDHMVDARLTPTDYGLRVRQHPDGMMITALNKMAHGQTREVTFAGQLVQTAFFHRDVERQRRNAATVNDWLTSLSGFRTYKHSLRWSANRDDIFRLLDQMQRDGMVHSKCSRFGPELIEFIRVQEINGGLQEWSVVVPMGEGRDGKVAEHPLSLVKRTDDTPNERHYGLSKANVQEPRHEMADLEEMVLTEEIVAEILAKLEVRDGSAAAVPMIKPGSETEVVRNCIGKSISEAVRCLGSLRGKKSIGAMREEMRTLRPAAKGLLLIYALDPTGVGGLAGVPYVPAFALSFPATHRARRVQYKVNQTWINKQLEKFGLEDSDDDDDVDE